MRRAIPLLASALFLLASPDARGQFTSTEVSGPSGLEPLVFDAAAGLWRWEDMSSRTGGPVVYHVYRREGRAGAFQCVAGSLPGNSWAGDGQTPAGDVWFYVVTAESCSGENSPGAGRDEAGTPIPRSLPAPCAGAPVSCEDGDPCTLDSCDPGLGCVSQQAPDDTPCPDADPCNGVETCRAGVCAPAPRAPLGAALVASGFNLPLYLTSAPGDATRLYVVEKGGRIRVVDRATGNSALFLDISGRVQTPSEQGLLGLAFHPEYDGVANRRFFVYYNARNDGGNIKVARYETISRDQADPATEAILLTVPHPTYQNHDGGMIEFRRDGADWNLYIGTGDGGGAGDPFNTGQNLQDHRGKILRINADRPPDPGLAYAIPPDNPFVAQGGNAREVWARGLRNPWRWSFDRATGDLWIADVGQGCWEEIDVELRSDPPGRNYGWDIVEGIRHCYGSGCADASCNQPEYADPVHEYPHCGATPYCGNSITGGYVYRGCALTGWQGRYFYADYDQSWIRSLSFDPATRTVSDIVEHTGPGGMTGIDSPASFGEGLDGELYVLNLLTGDVFRIVPR